MLLVVASKNPVKANSIVAAFGDVFPNLSLDVETVAANSGVSDQPMTDAETWKGAHNRLESIREQMPEADFWASIEGGVQSTPNGMVALAWVLIASRSGYGEAKTATFPLPPRMAQLVNDGVELGHACDRLYGKENSKHAEGAIGLLSNNLIDRQAYYVHAAIMALLPVRNPELYAHF